jgi:hypothetical protein
MGIRESINRNPKIAMGVGAGLIAFTVAFVLFEMMDFSGASAVPSADEHAFFTVDDGRTWFVGDIKTLAPFEHQGKQAVRAYVYECDGQRFAGFLERYTEEGKKARQQVVEAAKTGRPNGRLVYVSSMTGREVKRPGDATWTLANDAQRVESITTVKCPHDPSHTPQMVQP